MNFLDWLIILVVILGAIRGRRTGLVAIIGKFISFLAATGIAIIIYHPVAGFLDNSFGFNDTISTFLIRKLNFGQEIINYVAQFVVNAIAFLLAFLVFKWILKGFFKAPKKRKFTIIGSLNRLGGFLVGGASYFLKIAIVIVLLAPVAKFIGKDSGFLAVIGKQISGSLIANTITNQVAQIINKV